MKYEGKSSVVCFCVVSGFGFIKGAMAMSFKGITFIAALLLVFCGYAWSADNGQIADQAQTYVKQSGWTCKEFVQQVFSDLGGSLGTGYRQCYLNAGEEVPYPL